MRIATRRENPREREGLRLPCAGRVGNFAIYGGYVACFARRRAGFAALPTGFASGCAKNPLLTLSLCSSPMLKAHQPTPIAIQIVPDALSLAACGGE
jgi:hypothetical protein